MTACRQHIVLVTGDAPYLGGPITWSALRGAAPEFDFIDVDLLDAGAGKSLADTARLSIVKALEGSSAIVAHGTACRVAIEAVALVDGAIPMLLLSPRIITRQSLPLSVARNLAGGICGEVLSLYARRKSRRLLVDDARLRQQLSLLVRSDAVSEDLVDEARSRIADPRMEFISARTGEMVREVLTPIDQRVNEAVLHRLVLFGNGPMDRKMRARWKGQLIEGAWSAPMLEVPQAVAAALRALLSGQCERRKE